MGDDLPEKLYLTWRSSQADPTEHPPWGNVDADTRRAWESVALAARGHMAEQFVNSMRDSCQQQVAAGQAAIDASRSLVKALELWVR